MARVTGREPAPVEYFAFGSLDELLKSYGLIFDEDRCNFLGHDLGLFDDGGARYVTGMGDESYLYGYLNCFLRGSHHDPEDRFSTMSSGFRTLYGGYWLIGTPMDQLERELLATLQESPGADLVDTFMKGRNGQTIGHAPSLVMAALIARETLRHRDFEDLLRLVHSGSKGESFFQELESILGVDEASFSAAIHSMLDGTFVPPAG